jgi:hypothetical protein
MPFTGGDAARQGHHGRQRDRRSERRRHDAVEQEPRPHAVEPHARVAHHRGAVGGVPEAWPRAQRLEIGEDPIEALALFVEECRCGVVRGREVGEDGVEIEILAAEQIGKGAAQVVEAKPEPVHARVDLQVIANALLVPRGRGLHGARRPRRRDRRRQPAVEQAVEVTDAERAEDEDVGAHAGCPQGGAFLYIGAGQQVGAGILERPPNLCRAVTVRVRLDDADDTRRRGRPLALQMLADRPIVRLEHLEIDARDRRSNPFTHARSPFPG